MANIIKPTGEEWQEQRSTGQPETQAARFALSEYAEEWHFFNHGAFFSYAGFAYPYEDPVGDWYESQPIGTQLLLQPFVRPIIEGLCPIPGLGNITWGNVVCGVRKELWPALFEFLGGACSVDYKQKSFCQPFSGELDIPDPVLLERHGILTVDIPTIKLTVFCIDGNKQRWEVRPAASPTAPLRMVQMAPRPETIAMGRAVLSGDFSELQHRHNSAFRAHLDAYQQITGKDVIDAIPYRFTDGHRRNLENRGR